MSKCSRHHCQYHYHASAYGFAAEIERPVQQSLHAQAASALSGSGGRGSNRVESFSLPPFISFDAAYSEVGGSFDECHSIHTTYTTSVIEGLNIGDVVTADRIVCRMAIYSPKVKDDTCEPAKPEDQHIFDITGSYFDNLRIAGHRIEIELAIKKLQESAIFSQFESVFLDEDGYGEDLLLWGKQTPERLGQLKNAAEDYHPLKGLGQRAIRWKDKKEKHGGYRCSAAGHLDIPAQLKGSGLDGFGSIILIPRFGVVRLAEMTVEPHRRYLTMINVQMASPGSGGNSGPGGGGGTLPPFP